MIILFVGLPYSMHTVRWVNQIDRTKNKVFLMPSIYVSDLNLELSPGVTLIGNSYNYSNYSVFSKKYKLIPFNYITGRFFFSNSKLNHYLGKVHRILGIDRRLDQNLQSVLRKISPDIVHSFETQNAGYLVYESIKNHTSKKFKWFHSLWGSDLYYFQYYSNHHTRLTSLLTRIDTLLVEGNRDILLAKSLGYTNSILKIQATGELSAVDFIKPELLNIKRNIILIRARQDQARRGLVAIRALERSTFFTKMYEFHFYDISEEVEREIGYLKQNYPNLVIISHKFLSRIEFIKLLQASKYHMSISRSDGMPNTLIECMANGVFPIQSRHSCADEIINHGVNGYLVGSDDTDEIAVCLSNLPLDNEVFIRIAKQNIDIARKNYSNNEVERTIIELYQ